MTTSPTLLTSLLLCLWMALGAYLLVGDLIRGVVYYFGTGNGVMGRLGRFIELSTQGGGLVRELNIRSMETGLRPNRMRISAMLLELVWIYTSAAVLGIFGLTMTPFMQITSGILLATGLGCTIEDGKTRYFKRADREVNKRLVASETDFFKAAQTFGALGNTFHDTDQEIRGYTAKGLLQGNAFANRLNSVHGDLNLLDNGLRYGMWSTLDGAYTSIGDTMGRIRQEAQQEVEDTATEQAIETEEGAHQILETGIDLRRATVKVKKRKARKQFLVLAKCYHPDHNPNASQDELDELQKKFDQITRAHNYLKSIYK